MDAKCKSDMVTKISDLSGSFHLIFNWDLLSWIQELAVLKIGSNREEIAPHEGLVGCTYQLVFPNVLWTEDVIKLNFIL